MVTVLYVVLENLVSSLQKSSISTRLGTVVLSLLERSPEPNLRAKIVRLYKSDCIKVASKKAKVRRTCAGNQYCL